MNGAAFCRSISDEDDLKPIFELLEQHCPNAIWNIETNPLYFEESIEYLKKLGYIIR